jgi:hypothetical protein
MSGLGRKVFQPATVLTASEVNGYLMDQSVMVFDSSAARSTALGTAVSEGMVAYLKDVNSLELYVTDWEPIQTQRFTSSTATAFTFASTDANALLRFTSAGTLTIATATAFTEGQSVDVLNDATSLTIVPEGTAVSLFGRGTAQGTAGFLADNQYDAFSIVCVGTNAYRIIGNVSPI